MRLNNLDTLHTIYIVTLTAAIIMLVVTIVLFFVFDIRNVFARIFGFAEKKEIKQMEQNSSSTSQLNKKYGKKMKNKIFTDTGSLKNNATPAERMGMVPPKNMAAGVGTADDGNIRKLTVEPTPPKSPTEEFKAARFEETADTYSDGSMTSVLGVSAAGGTKSTTSANQATQTASSNPEADDGSALTENLRNDDATGEAETAILAKNMQDDSGDAETAVLGNSSADGDAETAVLSNDGDAETAVLSNDGDAETAVLSDDGDGETAVLSTDNEDDEGATTVLAKKDIRPKTTQAGGEKKTKDYVYPNLQFMVIKQIIMINTSETIDMN